MATLQLGNVASLRVVSVWLACHKAPSAATRLDDGMVKHITPQRIMGLRNMLNSSAMDIMYYTSPLYR